VLLFSVRFVLYNLSIHQFRVVHVSYIVPFNNFYILTYAEYIRTHFKARYLHVLIKLRSYLE